MDFAVICGHHGHAGRLLRRAKSRAVVLLLSGLPILAMASQASFERLIADLENLRAEYNIDKGHPGLQFFPFLLGDTSGNRDNEGRLFFLEFF